MSEKRLTSISPSSAAIHAVLVSLLLAYPAVALMRFFQHFDPQRADLTRPSPWWVVWALLPIGLALAASIWTLLATLAYNTVARILGGVRYNA